MLRSSVWGHVSGSHVNEMGVMLQLYRSLPWNHSSWVLPQLLCIRFNQDTYELWRLTKWLAMVAKLVRHWFNPHPMSQNTKYCLQWRRACVSNQMLWLLAHSHCVVSVVTVPPAIIQIQVAFLDHPQITRQPWLTTPEATQLIYRRSVQQVTLWSWEFCVMSSQLSTRWHHHPIIELV